MVTHPARSAVRYVNDPHGPMEDVPRRTAARYPSAIISTSPRSGLCATEPTGRTRTAGRRKRKQDARSAERPDRDGPQLTSTSGSDRPAPPPGSAIEEKCETTRSSVGSSAGVWCTASRL